MQITLEMDEKIFQDLLATWVARKFNITKAHIFREIYAAGSVADFVSFVPYAPGEIHIYECKMWHDKDKKRLERQIRSYEKVADTISVLVFGGTIENLPDHIMQYNANIMNGKFTVRLVSEKGYVENPKSNISLGLRVSLMNRMNKIWKGKSEYAEKIINTQRRKLERERKKNIEEQKRLEGNG